MSIHVPHVVRHSITMTAVSASDDLPLLAVCRMRLIVSPVIVANVNIYEEHHYHRGAVHIDIHNK